jgi:hypothetical protein
VNWSSRSIVSRASALAVAILSLLAIAVSPASGAVPPHPFKEAFGSAVKPQFEIPAGIAVDQATEDVYVIDLESHSLRRYKANGESAPFAALASNVIDGKSGEDQTPESEILSSENGSSSEVQVAVAPPGAGAAAGDIYVTDASNGKLDIFSPAGKYLGQKSFAYPCGVAVNAVGTVFVGNNRAGGGTEAALYKLNATSPGNLTEVAHFPTADKCLVAAGFGPAADSVFVNELSGPVTKLNASNGTEDYTFSSASRTFAVSSDPATGHVYVANEAFEIQEFDASGNAVREVSSTILPAPGGPVGIAVGVAVNPFTGDLYVSELANPEVQVFSPIASALTVTVVGSGAVECKDALSATFGPCAATYPESHTIVLRAVAASGSSFGGWTGFSSPGVTSSCSAAVAECEVTLGADASGTATFVANPTANLTVTRSGSGSGSVSSVPGGINCGSACESAFQLGRLITLEAAPDPGSAVVEWTGCDSVAGNNCHISFNAARTVGVVFARVPHSLTIDRSGTGGGSVSCDGGACSGSYPDGTTVTLSATPDSASSFTGWSGGGCSGTGSCTVTITADTAVTAGFGLNSKAGSPPALSPCVATVGSSATVTGDRASIQLTCASGTSGADGKVTLKAKVTQGKKQKSMVIGSATYNVAAGKSAMVEVKITNSQVKKQLDSGRAVKAQVSGDSVKSSTVKLKPKPAGKKGGHK